MHVIDEIYGIVCGYVLSKGERTTVWKMLGLFLNKQFYLRASHLSILVHNSSFQNICTWQQGRLCVCSGLGAGDTPETDEEGMRGSVSRCLYKTKNNDSLIKGMDYQLDVMTT